MNGSVCIVFLCMLCALYCSITVVRFTFIHQFRKWSDIITDTSLCFGWRSQLCCKVVEHSIIG